MKRDKPSGVRPSDLTMVHADAAAIDIGATMHVAAVGADHSAEPVRSFGTFTAGAPHMCNHKRSITYP